MTGGKIAMYSGLLIESRSHAGNTGGVFGHLRRSASTVARRFGFVSSIDAPTLGCPVDTLWTLCCAIPCDSTRRMRRGTTRWLGQKRLGECKGSVVNSERICARLANRRIGLRAAADLLHLRPFATAEDTVGAWRSLVAHLLWEHGATIPNERDISTAINELRVFHFANELVCGPICGPSDVMIRYAIHCDALQRASRAIAFNALNCRCLSRCGSLWPRGPKPHVVCGGAAHDLKEPARDGWGSGGDRSELGARRAVPFAHYGERWILGTRRCLFAGHLALYRPRMDLGREPRPHDPTSCDACWMVIP